MGPSEAIKVFKRRREFLREALSRIPEGSPRRSYITAEVQAISFFLEGNEVEAVEQLKRRIEGLLEKLSEQEVIARQQTQEAYKARKQLRELRDLQGYK